MYTYSFNIYLKDCAFVYMLIVLEAKDRFSLYDSIRIKVLNEKPENWSTSVEDSCQKKGVYTGFFFFNWLRKQSLWGYTGWIVPEHCSPHALYSVLKRSDEYNVIVDTDDPDDIGDPSPYYDSMSLPDVVY